MVHVRVTYTLLSPGVPGTTDLRLHKTCCFDLDPFFTVLQGYKNLEFSHIVQ